MNLPFLLVLVLDFLGIFEDEEENGNEDDPKIHVSGQTLTRL